MRREEATRISCSYKYLEKTNKPRAGNTLEVSSSRAFLSFCGINFYWYFSISYRFSPLANALCNRSQRTLEENTREKHLHNSGSRRHSRSYRIVTHVTSLGRRRQIAGREAETSTTTHRAARAREFQIARDRSARSPGDPRARRQRGGVVSADASVATPSWLSSVVE